MTTFKTIFPEGSILDIHLSNGNILMLNCQLLLRQERFAALAEGNRINAPQTDGRHILWPDGSRLGLDEVVELLAQ